MAGKCLSAVFVLVRKRSAPDAAGFVRGRIFTGIHPAPFMRLRQRADFRVNSSEAAYTAFSVDRSFGKIRLPPLFADQRVFAAVCSIV